MIDFIRMRRLLKCVPEYWSRRDDIIQGAATKGVQYSDMPKAPGVNSDKMAETMVRLQDIEEAFHEAITELHAMQAELVPYINQLQDPADKAIMRLRYLKGYTLDAITESADIHMERTTVYRKINEAERYITKLATSGT